jgi:hypothetical protein
VGRSASWAKSRRALFAENFNGSKKSKNFIFVPECADRCEQESTARFGAMACLVERLPPKQGFWLHPFLARRLQPIFGRASFAHASEHARKVLLRFETASNRHI